MVNDAKWSQAMSVSVKIVNGNGEFLLKRTLTCLLGDINTLLTL